MSVNWNGRTFGQLSPAEQTQAAVDAFETVAKEIGAESIVEVISDIDYGTVDQPTFHVFRPDGSEVMPGDTLTDFRGKTGVKYLGCKHPRKVMTDDMGCERYPSVYNLEIRGPEGYVWNPVTPAGRGLRRAYEDIGRPAW